MKIEFLDDGGFPSLLVPTILEAPSLTEAKAFAKNWLADRHPFDTACPYLSQTYGFGTTQYGRFRVLLGDRSHSFHI